VTLVDDQASYGGPLTVAVNQCRELRRRGHDARIMAGWAGAGLPPDALEGVPAHLFRVRRLVPFTRFSGLFSADMLAWLRKSAPSIDVAHIHTARDLVPLSAAVMLKRAGVPYTTQTHGMVAPDDRPQARLIDRLLTLRVLRGACGRFVLTDDEERALEELLGPADTSIRMPNGVSEPLTRHSPDAPLDVLFMARLHPRKRVMDFARAAQSLIHDGTEARFSVVGPDDGDLSSLTSLMTEDSALVGRLTYEGALDHDGALARLSRAGVFVLPSVNEPFPMSLLEALALGVPSVCTTSCGVAHDLRLDDAAQVVEPGVESLTEAIRTLVVHPERRAALSVAAHETARRRYSMAAVGDQLLSTYPRDEVLQ
jgi:glycosyltransferase involved in cell wall biosynthesis